MAAANQRGGGKIDDGIKVFKTEKGTFIAKAGDLLGKGTYGVVYRVRDEKDPSIVKAVKTFSPDTMDENEGIPSTTLREINALRSIDHPNVMTAEDVVIPAERSLTDMFVVMELCRGTLKDKMISLIEKNMRSATDWLQPPAHFRLPSDYVKSAKVVAWQLLNALAATHSRGVMHRDLKPVNIMWSSDDLLKIGDFGLARFVRGSQNSKNTVMPQTGEVQTMWYRAPEVLLGDERYGMKVDDWSIGCIIAELFRFRKSSSGRIETAPIFHGRSDVDTLMMIFDALGTPRPDKEVSHAYLAELPYWSAEYPKWTPTLRERVPLIDDQGFDLLKQLLCVSPCERQAAKFLLQHLWFHDIREEIQRFVPWFRGLEAGYEKMIAVDRLSPAKPLKLIEKKTEEIASEVGGNRKAADRIQVNNNTRNESNRRINETTSISQATSNKTTNAPPSQDGRRGLSGSQVSTTNTSTCSTTYGAQQPRPPLPDRLNLFSSLGGTTKPAPPIMSNPNEFIDSTKKGTQQSMRLTENTEPKNGRPKRALARSRSTATTSTQQTSHPHTRTVPIPPPAAQTRLETGAWPLGGRSRSPNRTTLAAVAAPSVTRRRRQAQAAAPQPGGNRRKPQLSFAQRLASDETSEGSVPKGPTSNNSNIYTSVKVGGRRPAAIVARGNRLITVSSEEGGGRLGCRRGGAGSSPTNNVR